MHKLKKLLKHFSFNSYAKQLNNDPCIYPHETFLEYTILNNKFPSQGIALETIFKIQKIINKVVIKPNQKYSYWKVIGKPSIEYSSARNNEYELFSSIIYYLSLISGLTIMERHHHSNYIFDNSVRTYPLGADAEVIFGSKDLKIKNEFKFPIKLKFEIKNQVLCGYILSTNNLMINDVNFIYRNYKNLKEVLTRINRRTIDVSIYKEEII